MGKSERKKSPLKNSEKDKNISNVILTKKENNSNLINENNSNLINENIENIFNSINIFYLSIYELILSIFMFVYYVLNTIRLIIMYYLQVLFKSII